MEPLRRALVRAGSLWTAIEVVGEAESTNALVVARADHADEGLVVVAEHQTAGRGRLDRTWVSPPRAGLTFSILLRPTAREDRWTWLPLLAGLAIVEALDEVAELDIEREVGLKWPNDVLIAESKVAGVLAERRGGVVVVGIGLNVSTRAAELPVVDGPAPSSLGLSGAGVTDRDTILRALLRAFSGLYAEWQDADGDSARLVEAYTARCTTLGRTVAVELPDGTRLAGLAERVDADGRLVIATAGTRTVVGSGDVIHLRAEAPGEGP